MTSANYSPEALATLKLNYAADFELYAAVTAREASSNSSVSSSSSSSSVSVSSVSVSSALAEGESLEAAGGAGAPKKATCGARCLRTLLDNWECKSGCGSGAVTSHSAVTPHSATPVTALRGGRDHALQPAV